MRNADIRICGEHQGTKGFVVYILRDASVQLAPQVVSGCRSWQRQAERLWQAKTIEACDKHIDMTGSHDVLCVIRH